MIEMRDRMEGPFLVSVGRNEPIPKSYLLHIREQFNDDGTVTTIHRKRLYEGSILHADGRIVDEEI